MPLVSRTFDQLIDFTRTSAATYVDASGRIVPTPASRNLLTFTQEFDNGVWTKIAATVTANAATAPDGTLTGDLLIPSTASSAHYAAVAATVVTATTYTYSCYVKANGYSKVGLRENAATGAFATFDLSTGAVISQAGGGTGSISSVGNGWFRISMTSASSGTSFIGAVYALDSGYTSGTPFSYTYTGNGTSGIYIWGAQLEAASTATDYTRNNGGVYPPRFDYDPVTLAPKGLLVEEQRTNLLTYSEEFDNAAWGKTELTVSTNTSTAPDGTATADAVIPTTNTAAHFVTLGVSMTAGVTYALSVYAKASGYRWLRLSFAAAAFPANNRAASFDLQTGTVGQVQSGVTATISDAGNGWYRCTIVATATTTAVAANGYTVNDADNANATSFAGNGTSGILLWGAQLEAGSFATSYIPTVASQVTRSADVATITGANFSSWYNQSEGTMVADWTCPTAGSLSNNLGAFSVSDGTSNGRIQVRRLATTSTASFIVVDGGVVQYNEFTVTSASGAFKAALAYRLNDFQSCANGTLGSVDTSGTLPTPTQAEIGFGQGLTYLNGHIRSLRFYPTRLTNAQLQALTA